MPASAHTHAVRDVVGPIVATEGLYLEDLEVVRAGARSVVRVVLDLNEDATGGLDLDRVAEVARLISDAIDATAVITGEHTLEVSSPGVSRPLTERRHFARARGRLVDLKLADGTSLTARLQDVDRTADDAVLVLLPETPGEKGRKAVVGAPVRLPLSDVRVGHVQVELGRLADLPDLLDDDLDDDLVDDDLNDHDADDTAVDDDTDPTGLEG